MSEETGIPTRNINRVHFSNLRLHWSSWILIALSVGFLIWSIGIEPDQLVVKEYTVSPPHWPKGLDGMRIALISDLHVGSLHIDENKVRKVVQATNASRPDLILLLGDYVCTIGGKVAVKPEAFSHWLAPLKARLGVFSVLGNHDWWYDGETIRAEVQGENIKVLENEAAEVRFNKKSLWLVGIADSWTRKPQLLKTMEQVPAGEPMLLLTHNPDVFPDVPASINLTLAGHTHGGQVQFPFVGALVVPSKFGARYARGLIVEDGRQIFISSGIGTSIFPIRFMVPPEISVLTLRSAEQ